MKTSSNATFPDRRIDTGLLVLRVGAGFSLLLIFGLQKLQAGWAFVHTGQWQFVDFNRKVGLPAPVLVAYVQTLNESLGALLLACGFCTRYAATSLALGFAVATFCSLKAEEPVWMMAAYFCLMFTTLLVTGPGQFSIDYLLHSGARSRSEEKVAAE
jgi:uncharacterized membrane protein YphA (DoxX/SURF4 family)